jgi:cytochrome d ubiquinol oxidase subunit II
VHNGAFAGGAFDWLTPYSLLVAAGLVAGYALLGSTWLIWRTDDELHGDARRWAWRATLAVGALLAAVSAATPALLPRAAERWGVAGGGLDWTALTPLLPIPILGAAGLGLVMYGLRRGAHGLPFAGAATTFLSGYLGLAVGFFPFVVPYALTFRDAANTDSALGLMIWGIAILLPVILGYTIWVYWIFRGKVGADAGYH